jgi:hypothetical protein
MSSMRSDLHPTAPQETTIMLDTITAALNRSPATLAAWLRSTFQAAPPASSRWYEAHLAAEAIDRGERTVEIPRRVRAAIEDAARAGLGWTPLVSGPRLGSPSVTAPSDATRKAADERAAALVAEVAALA